MPDEPLTPTQPPAPADVAAPSTTPAPTAPTTGDPVVTPAGPTISASDFMPGYEAVMGSKDVKMPTTAPASKTTEPATKPAAPTQPQPDVTKAPVPPAPESRDSVLDKLGIPAESRGLFKAMANTSFDYVVNRLQELQTVNKAKAELEQRVSTLSQSRVELPKTWYEHQDAFTLHPEYNTNLQQYQQAMREEQHWRNQLIRIERGERWQDLEVDAKGVVRTVEKEPTTEDKYAVTEWWNNAKAQARGAEANIHQLRDTFGARHNAMRQGIQARADKFFPQFVDEKARNSNEFYTGMNNVLKAEGLEGNVLSEMFCRMYAYLMEEVKLKKGLEAQLATYKTPGAPKPTLPSSDNLRSGGVGNGNGNMLSEIGSQFDNMLKNPAI